MTQAEKSLQEALNKKFTYSGQIITILGYEIDDERERVFIHTDVKKYHFDRPIIDVKFFLQKLKPVEMAIEKTTIKDEFSTPTQIEPYQNKLNPAEMKEQLDLVFGGNSQYLENILQDSITKLQADPEYIKQATAINNNVNSLINITKMKIDFVKRMNRR